LKDEVESAVMSFAKKCCSLLKVWVIFPPGK